MPDDVESVDVNPLIVSPDGVPIAVDALVELRVRAASDGATAAAAQTPTPAQFKALFEPRGVLVAGASSHPGKFGFVVMHNLLAAGYVGRVFGSNLQREVVLDVQTVADPSELPDDSIDLVVVCTPASANLALLRACAAKGATAAFVTSAGYGEAGEQGKQAEAELVALCAELGILLAGPNGQGVVSTPVHLCAQMVAPYPPAGRIGIASQSGNFVSSFLNLVACVRCRGQPGRLGGNAAAVSVADFLDHYAEDEETAVGLAYVEGIGDGRVLIDRFGQAAARKPLVLVKGGATEGGRPRRGEPHRRAGGQRQGVRRSLPGSRDHPGRDHRRGVRGGRHVRHPTAAARTERRRADHGRRMGGRHRRRHHPGPRPRAARAARRSPRRHRPVAAAALEPQQPGRLRRRRDP